MCQGEYVLMTIVADIVLKMPHVDRKSDLALGLSSKIGRTRAMVYGLRNDELDNILEHALKHQEIETHLAVVTELIRTLLKSYTKTIVKIAEDMKYYDDYLNNSSQGRNSTLLLNCAVRSGDSTSYSQATSSILYLFQHIEHRGLIGVITELDSYSKRIAEERKYNIEGLRRNNRPLVPLV